MPLAQRKGAGITPPLFAEGAPVTEGALDPRTVACPGPLAGCPSRLAVPAHSRLCVPSGRALPGHGGPSAPLCSAPGFGGRWPPRRAWAASLPPPPGCAAALPFGTLLRVGRAPAGGRGLPPGCLRSAPGGPARSARRKACAMRLAPLAGAPGASRAVFRKTYMTYRQKEMIA